MERATIVLALVAFVVTWNLFLYRRTGWRMWSPLWMAFSLTFGAGLFLIAGAMGYTLSRHDRFVAGTAWSDAVIWWQIWTGLAVLPVAAYLWRRAFTSAPGAYSGSQLK